MSDRKRDVVGESKNFTGEDMSADMFRVENSFDGYWCEGVKCCLDRTHWVLHESESNCWDCMHYPCGCSPPLVWDEAEKAYCHFLILRWFDEEQHLDVGAGE